MKLWESAESSLDRRAERVTAAADLQLDRALVRYDILGSLAHVLMLKAVGLLTPEECSQLEGALSELLQTGLSFSAGDEDVHTAVENALTRKLGPLGEKLHTGRSRNDQVLVDTRLYSKDALLEIITRLLSLARQFEAFARRHERVLMPGYTHTRRAMPSSVGLWAASYAEALLDHLQIIEAAYRLSDQSPLGAAAGYGVPLPLDRELTAKLLGFRRVQRNALWAISSRGVIEFTVVAALSALMISLSRLAEDLIWFSSAEFGFFVLPQDFLTGSSLMPQKRNPDVAELVRGRSAEVLARLVQLALTVKNLPSGYHRDSQETKGALMSALTTSEEVLAALGPLIEGLQVNEERLKQALSPQIFATDELCAQVKRGVPFRQAYRQVHQNLGELQRKEPEEVLRARTALGSPGNLGLGELQQTLDEEMRKWNEERERFDRTLEKLWKQHRGLKSPATVRRKTPNGVPGREPS